MSDPRHDIAALLPSVGVFGGVRRFIEIGNELVRRGHRFTIYHPEGYAPDWIQFNGDVKSVDALRDAMHEVVVCNDPPLWKRFQNVRARRRLFYFAAERIPNEKHIVRSEWTMLANSEGMARYLERNYRVPVHRVIGGINLDVFRPGQTMVRDPDEFRILTFGRVSRRKKGVDIVRRAVEALTLPLGDPRRVRLILFDHVGPANEKDPRESFETSIPVEWHLNLAQAELPALYGSCDVFVNAEKRAGWTNTVAEAMACRVPVVCTRSGTVDMARHKNTAWVVPLRHPWLFRRGIETLAGDAAFRDAIVDAAANHIPQFSWPVVTDRLLEVIRT